MDKLSDTTNSRKLNLSVLKKRWLKKKTESDAEPKKRNKLKIINQVDKIIKRIFHNCNTNSVTYCEAPRLPAIEDGIAVEPVNLVTDLDIDLPEPLDDSPQNGLSNELFNLTRWGWYWGPISPQEAEDKLRDTPNGTFLVRDSSADRYLLSVSFRSSGKTLHSRIEYDYGKFRLNPQEEFPTIPDLINHSILLSQSSAFCFSRPTSFLQPAYPVRLTKPLSRFMQVMSLQYLCRFVIRQYTALDNINKLPISPTLKKYLLEGYF